MDQELLSGLPFYTEGPRAANGKLYGPDAAPMTLALFVEAFAEWVTAYNTVRPHSALGGQTPLQRWNADPTPIQEVPAGQLRWLLLADAERTIGRDGIHFGGHTFIAAGLNGRAGQRVQVRYTRTTCARSRCSTATPGCAPPTRRTRCPTPSGTRCWPGGGPMPPNWAGGSGEPSRRARARLAPITAPGEPEETTVISAADARAARRGRDRDGERDIDARDRDIQQLACTDLLNLHTDFDYWNRPSPLPQNLETHHRAPGPAAKTRAPGSGTEMRGERAALPGHRRGSHAADRAAEPGRSGGGRPVATRAMGAVHGQAGLGKTFAVEAALARRTSQVSACWVSFPSRPTMRLVAATLLGELSAEPAAGRRDRFALSAELLEQLADHRGHDGRERRWWSIRPSSSTASASSSCAG